MTGDHSSYSAERSSTPENGGREGTPKPRERRGVAWGRGQGRKDREYSRQTESLGRGGGESPRSGLGESESDYYNSFDYLICSLWSSLYDPPPAPTPLEHRRSPWGTWEGTENAPPEIEGRRGNGDVGEGLRLVVTRVDTFGKTSGGKIESVCVRARAGLGFSFAL